MAETSREQWMSRDFSDLMPAEGEEVEYVETRFGRARAVPGYHVDEDGFVVPDRDDARPDESGIDIFTPVDAAEADALDPATDAAAPVDPDADPDAAPEEEPDPEPTFEEKLARLRQTVNARPPLRHIFRKILLACQEQRPLLEVEEEVAAYPEFKHAALTQFQLFDQLIASYGLEFLELGEEGELITPDMKEGLDEDEADDLVWSHALLTTDVGRAMADELSPQRRIKDVIKEVPLRRDLYTELLDFCSGQKRTYREILDLFHGRPELNFSLNKVSPQMPIEPSVLVSKMEKAGGLVWDDGWKLTREGRVYLEEIQKAMMQG